MHSFPAGAHIFAEHDVVERRRTDKEEELFDRLLDEALLHAVLTHGAVKVTELLKDEGDGVGLRVFIDTVGTLPEAGRLHARNPLKALVLQHTGNCWSGRSGSHETSVKERPFVM